MKKRNDSNEIDKYISKINFIQMDKIYQNILNDYRDVHQRLC